MNSQKSIGRRLAMVGCAAFVLGGTLLGAAVVAGAATPTITLSLVPAGGFPTTKPFTTVLVQGTGFVPKVRPWIVECNVATSGPSEPTMTVTANQNNKHQSLTLPVGCSVPSEVAVAVDSSGNLPVAAFTVAAGTVGPPGPGNDSSGASGATDAANFPCPPFVHQAGTNACELEVIEPNLQSVTASITFAGSNQTPETTIAATTTTAPCNKIDGTATSPGSPGALGTGTATVNEVGGAAPTGVTQAVTCVLGGDVVQVAASGLSVGNGGVGTLLECNSTAGQPTVLYVGHGIPVSCTSITSPPPFSLLTNSFAAHAFTITQGITGPPTSGTDSAGHDAAADAQAYPCPPTAAQVANGATCVIAVGTAYLSGPKNSDQLPVPISFNLNAIAAGGGTTSNNATKASSQTTAPAAKAGATKAGSSSLAFTGAGPGLWWLGALGVLLMLLGGLSLVLVEGPRRFLRFAVDHGRRARGEESG